MTMTAPDGAYIIGGGRYHFGQAMTEDLARAAFEFPLPTLGNMIELLRSVLEQLPLDALKPFQGFLGIPDNLFGNIVDAVNSIISSLQNRPVFMLLADFTTWVADFIKAITGTVTSGSLADLSTWVQQNVVDKIANLGTEIAEVVQKIVQAITGSLGGFDDLKNWITGTLSPVIDGFTAFIAGVISLFGGNGAVASVTEALAALKNWLDNIFKPVQDGIAGALKILQDLIDGIFKVFGGTGINQTVTQMIAQITSWLGGAFKAVQDGVTAITGIVQKLLDAIFGLFGGTAGVDKTVTEAIAAMTGWFGTTFKAVSDGLAALVKKVQDLFDGIWQLFTGNTTGTGKDLATTLGAISSWLDTIFKPVKDGLTAVVDTVQALLDTIFKLFGGIDDPGKTITEAVAALEGWFGNFHKLLDALFGAFGGVAGTDKTIADVIGAITGWFTGVFQKLIDGINALATLIPGFSTGTNPIQNAIDIIAGILGIGQSAAASAAQANLGVAAIVAGQNGGGHDDFDYPTSPDLPAPWVSTYTGNATSHLGPDGRGFAVWKYSGLNNTWRTVHYRKSDVDMPNSDCIITVVLSKAPGRGSTDASCVWIEALWSATDQSRLRVQIGPNYAQLESVSATGTITDVGAKHTIPNVQNGDSFSLKIRGNDVSLMTGTITHFTETVTVGSFTGRQFGFGAFHAGVLLGYPSGPELTGIIWQN